jgi:hypothetical protein
VRKTIQNLFVEYGAVAVVVYLALFFAVLFGFWAAIRFGWQPTSVMASAGTWTAAYIATKVTQPLRIAATIAATPFLARLYERTLAPVVGKWYARATGRPQATPLKEVAPDEE